MISAYGEQLQKMLFQDFDRAWILITLIFFLISFLLRWLLTSAVKKHAKRISSKNLGALHRRYLLRSFAGWLCYGLAVVAFILYWYIEHYQIMHPTQAGLLFLAGSVGLFLLSVVFHLTAYSTACLDQIKLLEDKQLAP